MALNLQWLFKPQETWNKLDGLAIELGLQTLQTSFDDSFHLGKGNEP